MPEAFETPHEQFWASGFGDEYVTRNTGPSLIADKTSLFAEMLRSASQISSICELGANIGGNLEALLRLLPSPELTAVEINPSACEQLRQLPCTVVEGSLLQVDLPTEAYDLVFTCGVLIHIDPDHLSNVYDLMVRASRRYVLVAEYYNPTPVSVAYRGHEDRLFKRDFAGELLDAHGQLELRDYGFRYHRDPFPADDITWFLLERR